MRKASENKQSSAPPPQRCFHWWWKRAEWTIVPQINALTLLV